MLWNLSFLEEEERINPDFKQLIDNLRVNNLFPYYLSSQYREAAKDELTKVNWDKQPIIKKRLYRLPVFMLKCRRFFLRIGSSIKQIILQAISTQNSPIK